VRPDVVVNSAQHCAISPGASARALARRGPRPRKTIDPANGGFGKKEGDNEITGMHVSDGNPTANGILGAQVPHLLGLPVDCATSVASSVR
jgi:hypothetical protein